MCTNYYYMYYTVLYRVLRYVKKNLLTSGMLVINTELYVINMYDDCKHLLLVKGKYRDVDEDLA
jgi:hypothetical protein